ncbi:MAG: isoprenylcysteine carboxylmethyltransferase family protein [Parvularculaceae bacterium]
MAARSSLGKLSARAANALFVIVAPGVVGLAAPLALHFLSPEYLRFDVEPVRYAGAAALVCGLLLYALGMRTQMRAGESPSPLVASRTLVTDGVYRACRNPMYVAGAFYFVGLAALLQSWLLAAYSLAVILLYYPFLVGTEERALRRAFGAEYDAYCAATPRWAPRLSWPKSRRA